MQFRPWVEEKGFYCIITSRVVNLLTLVGRCMFTVSNLC
jgi:hypothetical protein